MNLTSKTALVTGASRGIGRAIALRLAAQGAHVLVHFGSNRANAEDVAREIGESGGSASLLALDLSEISQFSRALESVDSLDILVNNAGHATFAPLGAVDETAFDALFDLNVRGLFFLTQTLLPKLRDNGRIVNISSGITRANAPGGAVYAATKSAVEAFTRCWAAELGPRGITVNTVSPGMTETDLLREVTTPDGLEEHAKQTPLGRIGQPRDIADVVAWLCSDEARWITANNLLANGGAS